jgi:hypothetical protein
MTRKSVASARPKSYTSRMRLAGAVKIRARIERESRAMLGVSSRTAFRWIKAGKLRGTIAEAELTGLQSLLAIK